MNSMNSIAGLKPLFIIGIIVLIGYIMTRPCYRKLDGGSSTNFGNVGVDTDVDPGGDRLGSIETYGTHGDENMVVGVRPSKLNMRNEPLFEPHPQPGPKIHLNDMGLDVGLSQKRHGETPMERISVAPIKEDLRIYPASDMLRREIQFGDRSNASAIVGVQQNKPPPVSEDASIAPRALFPPNTTMPASAALKADIVHPDVSESIPGVERTNAPNRTCIADVRSCEFGPRDGGAWSLKPFGGFESTGTRVSMADGFPVQNRTQSSKWSSMSDPTVDVVRRGARRGVDMPVRENIQPSLCSDIQLPERTGLVDANMRMPSLGSAIAMACKRVDEDLQQTGTVSSGITKAALGPQGFTDRRGDTRRFGVGSGTMNRKAPLNVEHSRDAEFSNTRVRIPDMTRPGLKRASTNQASQETLWTLNDSRCDNNMTSTGIGSYGRKPAAASSFDVSASRPEIQMYRAPAHGCERAPRAEDLGTVNASGNLTFTPWTTDRLQPTSIRINPMSTVDKKSGKFEPRTSLARVFDERAPDEHGSGVASNRVIGAT
jgi:hypothetical protein